MGNVSRTQRRDPCALSSRAAKQGNVGQSCILVGSRERDCDRRRKVRSRKTRDTRLQCSRECQRKCNHRGQTATQTARVGAVVSGCQQPVVHWVHVLSVGVRRNPLRKLQKEITQGIC